MGSLARYVIANWINATFPSRFPWGILTVNVGGSFLIGFLIAWFTRHASAWPWQPLLIVGFLGGLTTFSTLTYDTATAYRQGQAGIAIANLTLNLILGLAAVGLGLWLGDRE